jgi:hypothetical protein
LAGSQLEALGQLYKQIDAPFGSLAKDTLKVSTFALLSKDPGDVTYNNLENKIAAWTTQRDALAAQLQSILEGAELGGKPVNEWQSLQVFFEGIELLGKADACAEDPHRCAKF